MEVAFSSNYSIIHVILNMEFDSIDIWRRPDQMASPDVTIEYPY